MKDYNYLHDEGQSFAAGEKYFPDEMDCRLCYHSVDRGLKRASPKSFIIYGV
jgi:putative ATPase